MFQIKTLLHLTEYCCLMVDVKHDRRVAAGVGPASISGLDEQNINLSSVAAKI